MNREQIEARARIAELKAKNEAATSWGAAVGARSEEIKDMERQLRAMTPSPSSAGSDRPLAWRFEAATQRVWRDGKPVGWDGWKWCTTDFEPNMGDAMRNVTPLYPRDDGAQAASIPSKEQIAAQVLLAMSDKVGSDDYGVSYALKINKGRAEKAAESILSLIAAQPPAAPVETCQHEAIISLDGKWHCQKCAAPIEMTTAQSDPVSPSSAGTVDAIATLMIREMFADHELPVDEAIFHKYEDIARKILAHIPAVPQTLSTPEGGK